MVLDIFFRTIVTVSLDCYAHISMNGSPNYLSSRSSDSTEEGVLNTLWEDYENAHDQVCPLSLVDRPFLLVCPLGLDLACVQQGMFYNGNKMYFSFNFQL
jgi:hypothetical protein